MRRPVGILVGFFGAVAVAATFACTDLSGSSVSVLSLQFDTLPSPSVVVGDTLRDTTGAVIHPVVHAFDFEGDEITPSPAYFLSPDSGVTVDSATGIVVGDSLRSTPARIIAAVGNLQAIQRINVTLRPDTIVPVHAVDTISYSLTDSTKNISPLLTVMLTHGDADSAVSSYIVSFAIVSQHKAGLVELVNDSRFRTSVVDTTDASGIAGRMIRLHPVQLDSLTQVDSVAIDASAKYRGALVAGSPVRLVLLFKPGS